MDEWIKVAVLDNDFEAQVLDSLLREDGVEHYLKSYQDAAYDGLFQRSGGWGAVYAPASLGGVIRRLLEEIRRQADREEGAGDERER